MPKRKTTEETAKRKRTKTETPFSVNPPVKWEWQGASESPSNINIGILKLSSELIDEVLSYLGCTTDRTSVESHVPLAPAECLELTETLRTLSQACAYYRKVFLPMQWHTLDACCDGRPDKSRAWYIYIGKVLKRKSIGLRDHPELAQYVRAVRVVVTRYEKLTLLSEFALCLQSLPNVQILHLLHAHTQMTTFLKQALQDVVLPTIQKAILPDYAHQVLLSCPNVTFVRCIDNDGSKLVTAIRKVCQKVEVLEGIGSSTTLVKRVVKAAPKLKAIGFRHCVSVQDIQELGALKFLQKIELERLGGPDFPLDVAKNTLKASSSKGRKVVKVRYRNGERQECMDVVLDG